jgi:hypothetical protein
LTQTGLDSHDEKYVVLVSGVGDGGVLDVLRAKLKEFDHGGFLDECVQRLDTKHIREQVVRIESGASARYFRRLRAGDSKEEAQDKVSVLLDDAYSGLAEIKSALNPLFEKVRPRTKVVWIGTTTRPCSLSSQPLNRVLSWQLSKRWPLDIEYHQGHVARVSHLNQEGETGFRFAVNVTTPSSNGDLEILAHQVVLRHGPANEIERSFRQVATELKKKAAPEVPPTERLPDDVRKAYHNRYQELEIRPRRTAWHKSIRLRARPGGGPRLFEGHRVYRITVWLDGDPGSLKHVTWVDYDLHPEYDAVQRRAMWIGDAKDHQFRHWINTWDDFWVRVRCNDGSEFGEWLSIAIEQTPGYDLEAKECVEALIGEACNLRGDNRYRSRDWCDYVDRP